MGRGRGWGFGAWGRSWGVGQEQGRGAVGRGWWRDTYAVLSLNGPGVTVTNSTSLFCWLDWRYKTATLSWCSNLRNLEA